MARDNDEGRKDLYFKALARDLVEAHNAKRINLGEWPAAREHVVAHYDGEKPIASRWADIQWNGEPYTDDKK